MSATLAWTASSDDTGVLAYDVLQDGVHVASVSSPTVTVSGLTAGTSYAFTVRARDAAGNTSAASAPITARTADPPPPDEPDTAPPSVPAGLHAMSTTATSAELMWSAATDVVGVTGYELLRDGVVVRRPPARAARRAGCSPTRATRSPSAPATPPATARPQAPR